MSSWWGSSSPSKEAPKDTFSDTFAPSSSSPFDSGSSSAFDSHSHSHSSSASGSGGGLGGLEHMLMEEQQRMEVQQAVMKIADLCFQKCVTKPSDRLSSSEQSCISNYAGKFLDTSMFISGRIMKQHSQQQH